MADIDLPLTTKRKTYLLLSGVVVSMLTAGLLVPVAVGERTGSALAAGGNNSFDTSSLGSGGDGASGSVDPTGTPGADGTDGTGGAGGDGAGGVGGVTGFGSTTPTTLPAGTELRASDVGVTATTIKIGLLIPTSEAVGDPNAQSSAQRQQFEVFLDEINDRGGINGRRLEIAVATYDILDQDTGTRAACLKLADDDKVFAAFNTTGFGPPGALCLTREKKVPFLQGSGHPDEVYTLSAGLYSSSFDSQTRNLRNMVAILNQLGTLKGKKIGVLGTEWIGLRKEQEEGIIDTLKSFGFDPFVYWLSGDPASSQSQIPVAVQQMQSNGVELVIFGADFISGASFVQQAESQLYRPGYAAADPWGWSTDFTVSTMPASFEGAVTVTAMRTYDARVGVAEPAPDAACREIYERRTGTKLDRANDPNALYVATMWACGVVQRFEMAASRVGVDLTRGALAHAVTGLGTVAVPYAGGPGTFGPGKLDGVNHYRPQRWKADCKCWVPLVAEFTPGRY